MHHNTTTKSIENETVSKHSDQAANNGDEAKIEVARSGYKHPHQLPLLLNKPGLNHQYHETAYLVAGTATTIYVFPIIFVRALFVA